MTRFSCLSIIVLFLNGAIGLARWVNISPYGILAARNGTASSPYTEALSLQPFNKKIYIKAHEQTLNSGTKVTVELFANVTVNSPCNKGILLTSSAGNNISSNYYKYEGAPSAYTPTTSDGIIGKWFDDYPCCVSLLVANNNTHPAFLFLFVFMECSCCRIFNRWLSRSRNRHRHNSYSWNLPTPWWDELCCLCWTTCCYCCW